MSPASNEADAFRRLYDENHERVRRFLTRTAGPQEAEDLTQVVFAKAAKSLSSFRGAAQSSTWLYRIAANVASDWLRGRATLEARATIRLPDEPDGAACDPGACSDSQRNLKSPEQELIREEMGDCVRRLVGRLPENYRNVLMLGEFGGLTDDEVARTLGISRSNAKVRLHRARAQLRRALDAHCEFSRNEENEFVCEPKPAARDTSSRG